MHRAYKKEVCSREELNQEAIAVCKISRQAEASLLPRRQVRTSGAAKRCSCAQFTGLSVMHSSPSKPQCWSIQHRAAQRCSPLTHLSQAEVIPPYCSYQAYHSQDGNHIPVQQPLPCKAEVMTCRPSSPGRGKEAQCHQAIIPEAPSRTAAQARAILTCSIMPCLHTPLVTAARGLSAADIQLVQSHGDQCEAPCPAGLAMVQPILAVATT